MLYSNYEIIYYTKSGSFKSHIKEYIVALSSKERAKLHSYIDLLWKRDGKLAEPYAKHMYQKIWELRVKFGNRNHRFLYFLPGGRKIVLLSAFLKKSRKTPRIEIQKAYNYYLDYSSQ